MGVGPPKTKYCCTREPPVRATRTSNRRSAQAWTRRCRRLKNVAQRAIKAWLEAVGVEVHWTEDVNTLAGQLGPSSDYKAVIFLSTSRDTLWKHGTAVSTTAAVNTTTNAHLDAAKTALRQFVRAGGGFVGIHNAFGTEYNWHWYEGLLGNANYYDHGAFQDGMVKIVAQDSSTSGISNFAFKDEWYNLEPFPTL